MRPLPEKNQIKQPKLVDPIPMNSLHATIAKPEIVIEYKEKIIPLAPKPNSVAKQSSPKKPLLYTIQVGAYKTKAYAKKLEKSLKKKGYDAFVTRNAKKIYRVQVDRFNNKEDALTLAQRIQTKENLKNFVTRFFGV